MSHRQFPLRCRATLAVSAGAVALGIAAAPAPAAQQSGLVNVDLTGNTIQVPIGIAANVCDVSVAVLSTNTFGGDSVCTAVSRPSAQGGGGGGGGGAAPRSAARPRKAAAEEAVAAESSADWSTSRSPTTRSRSRSASRRTSAT